MGDGAEKDDGSDRKPDHGYDVPRRAREDFEIVLVKEACGVLQVARRMHLLEVKLLGKVGTQHLRHERLVEVEEFVRLVVGRKVGLLGMKVFGDDDRVILARVATLGSALLECVLLSIGGRQTTNDVLVEQLVGRIRVRVLLRIVHDLAHVLAGVLDDEVISTRVILDEIGDIVHVATVDEPTVGRGVVLCDVVHREQLHLGRRRRRCRRHCNCIEPM